MNKTDIITEVANVTCAEQEAKDAVNEFIDTVKNALERG